ncbi:sulfite exporter TauE/SafE family protein [Lacticaseibacillus jixiensis]|uniref:sulfite exporter TauE/SafE family protein n=1 Tax=Lacticaseibacillus jixiensis TaxID=3231926 RepID=UPI0036F229A6
MHPLLVIYIIAAGIVAGLLSTIAGMASLVSYPVLLSLGLPPLSANVTNTAAQIFTGIGSTLSARKELSTAPRATARITIWALIGSVCGCVLLLMAPAASFAKAVPFLIAFAGCLMLYSLHAKPSRNAKPVPPILKGIAIFLVGIYVGYFGASAGVITLAILTVTEQLPFATLNAIKNFTSFAANALAMVIYAFTADIHWSVVLIMGVGFLIGGYIGPQLVRHLPVRPLRYAIAFAAFGLAIYLGITTYR